MSDKWFGFYRLISTPFLTCSVLGDRDVALNKIVGQIWNVPSALKNYAESELIIIFAWIEVLMKIFFSVKSFFSDFDSGQKAYYHFFYQRIGARRYVYPPIGVFLLIQRWNTSFIPQRLSPNSTEDWRYLTAHCCLFRIHHEQHFGFLSGLGSSEIYLGSF